MGTPHRRVDRQLTLDLAGFDAEATDLYLAVKPADEGDESIGIGARTPALVAMTIAASPSCLPSW